MYWLYRYNRNYGMSLCSIIRRYNFSIA